jgi:hypothetical protein
MIRQANYEVGQDLIDRFVAVDPNTSASFRRRVPAMRCSISPAMCVVAAAAGRDRGD